MNINAYNAMSEKKVSRRDYLFAAGVAGIISVSGCSSSSDNDTVTPTLSSSDNETPTSAVDQIGEPRLSSGETRLVVNDVVATQTLYAVNGFRNYELSTEDGKQFILVDIEAKKQTENGTVPEVADYRIEAESASYSIDNVDVDSLSRPVNANLYEVNGGLTGPEIGSTTRGWLVFEIPADVSAGTLRVREMQTQDEQPISWDLEFDDAKTVTFAEEIQLPEEAEVATTIEATVSVENTGGRTGRYATVVTSDLLSDSRTLEYTIDAGETREETFEMPVNGYYEGSINFSVGSINTADMDIVAPEVPLGDTWTGPRGIEYTVSELGLTQSPESEELEVDDDEQVAVVRLTVSNPTTEHRNLPERYQEPLAAIVGDQSYTNIEGRSVDHLELTSPVDGTSYPRTLLPSDPGDEVSGLMIFYLPASVSRSDIEIRLSHRGARAVWMP